MEANKNVEAKQYDSRGVDIRFLRDMMRRLEHGYKSGKTAYEERWPESSLVLLEDWFEKIYDEYVFKSAKFTLDHEHGPTNHMASDAADIANLLMMLDDIAGKMGYVMIVSED